MPFVGMPFAPLQGKGKTRPCIWTALLALCAFTETEVARGLCIHTGSMLSFLCQGRPEKDWGERIV